MILRVNAMSFAIMVRRLFEDGYTYSEMAEEVGLHYHTVREWMNELHRQGVIHVHDYVPDGRGRRTVKSYKFGIGARDKKKPTPKTQAQRQREWRASAAARKLPSVISQPQSLPRAAA